MNACSDSNDEATPYKCCMHSSGMVKLSTDVMSENINNCLNQRGLNTAVKLMIGR